MSLWTRTPMFRIERGPLLIQTLAANLAARVFVETEFVTDLRGAGIAVSAAAWHLSGGSVRWCRTGQAGPEVHHESHEYARIQIGKSGCNATDDAGGLTCRLRISVLIRAYS